MVSTLQGMNSVPFAVEYDTAHPMNDRDQPLLDVSVAQNTLGWKAETTIQKGLARTYGWYQSYFAKKEETK
jgi:nucleoside-diphosphate-sugar epimerase